MKLTDPVWVHHEGGPIYSIDLHPSGKKFATCGQFRESGKGVIMVWNVEPIINEKMAECDSCEKCLAVIHQRICINCVRWSCKGEWLACAGDDGVLTIYEYGGRISSLGSIGSKNVTCLERYREKHHLQGHEMDVLHLEWSQDGRYLASGGMCARIYVWDVQNFPKKVVVLDSARNGHVEHIKGLSWDPIGKFLASQSCDRTLKIWTVDSWQCVKTISKPFAESCVSTMFCRLDWSPDGAYLVAPCAMNNSGPTAQLIRRRDWDTSLDLVGHRKAISVVRVCPKLIEYVDHKGRRSHVCCFAMGSRDKTLSIWLVPNISRPLVVVQHLFKHSILDLSWNDLHLTISSLDGSIKSIVLDTREVGRLLSAKEMGDICEKLYSRRPVQYCDDLSNITSDITTATKDSFFVDDFSNFDSVITSKMRKRGRSHDNVRRVEDQGTKKRARKDGRTAPSVPTAITDVATSAPSTTQTESLTATGKRRIQPVGIALLAPQNDGMQKTCAISSESSSCAAAAISAQPAAHAELLLPTGKRRIQPTFVASLAPQKDGMEKISAISKGKSKSLAVVSELFEKPSELRTKPALKTTEQFILSDSGDISHFNHSQDLHIQLPLLRLLPPPDIKIAKKHGESSITIPIPVHEAQLTVHLTPCVSQAVDRVDVINDTELSTSTFICKLYGLVKEVVQWTCVISTSACKLSATNVWSVVACYDRHVSVYSTQSGLLHLNVLVDSVASYVNVADSFLSVCTSEGYAYVWDLLKKKSILSRRSLRDIMETDASITFHMLSDNGAPIIGMSSGKTYIYSLRMECWQPVNNTSSAAQRMCGSASSRTSSLSHPYSLATLLPSCKSVPVTSINDLRCSAFISILEERMHSAFLLHLPREFRRSVNFYVRTIAQAGAVKRLSDLFAMLSREKVICGLKSELLIRELIAIVQSDSRFTNVVKEVNERLV